MVAGKWGFTLDIGHALSAFSDEDCEARYERALKASFDGLPFKVIQSNVLITESWLLPGQKISLM